MPKTVTIPPPKEGDVMHNIEEKIFPDYKAEEGDQAYVFMHTVPFEGSVGLVNMLTATRIQRKGFKLTFVLYGPAVLMANAGPRLSGGGPGGLPPATSGTTASSRPSSTRAPPSTACRFAMGALYGMREDDVMEGVIPLQPARRSRRHHPGLARQGSGPVHLDPVS